jgi:anaerobic glycerol-3-phosphate dehydrogenase
MSIGARSREFPNTLTKMLASQEGMNTAVSSQGDDALTFVDILDRAGKPPETKRAQEIVDALDSVRQSGNKYLG